MGIQLTESVARQDVYLKLILGPFSAAGVGRFCAAGVLFQQLPLMFQQLPLIFQQSLPSIVPFSMAGFCTLDPRNPIFPSVSANASVFHRCAANPLRLPDCRKSGSDSFKFPLIIVAMVCLGDFFALAPEHTTRPFLLRFFAAGRHSAFALRAGILSSDRRNSPQGLPFVDAPWTFPVPEESRRGCAGTRLPVAGAKPQNEL